VAHKIINESADDLRENDDDDPNQLVVADAGLVGGAVDQHPDPKRESSQGDRQEDEQNKQFR